MKNTIILAFTFVLISCSDRDVIYVEKIPPPILGGNMGDFGIVKLQEYIGRKHLADYYKVLEINGKRVSRDIFVRVEFWGIENPGKKEFTAWASDQIAAFGEGDPPAESGIDRSPYCFQIHNKLNIHKIIQ